MLYTDNIGLKKPAYSDPADIADINENSDIIDREFGNRYLKSETYSVEQANNAIAQAIEALPNGLVYRGAVNYYKDLPTANNELGDTYSVKYQGETGTTADGNEYAWGEYDGALQWIKLGVNAYTKNEIDEQHEVIKSDILTARNELTSMSSKMLISSEARTVASKGWYRVFSSTVKGTSRNGLVLLGHNYGTHYTENYLLAFNCGHQKNEFNMIKRFYEISPLNVITKIRIVSKQAGPQNNECHIDIYYNYDAANTVYVSILEDTENNVGRPFTPVKFTTAEIPEGYTSTEFDLTEKDIFDRITALENK